MKVFEDIWWSRPPDYVCRSSGFIVNPPPYEECILGSGLLEVDAATDPDNRYGDASFTPVYTMARGARLDYSFANFEDN